MSTATLRRYCFNPVWQPLDYFDDGQHKGVIAEYLLEKADQPQRNREAIAAIQTAAATLLRLIDDILDLSKSQCNAPSQSSSTGVGLGLAICDRLTRLIGGEIRLRSEPGHGSTFRLQMPLIVSAAPPSAVKRVSPARDPPTIEFAPARILIADDDPLNRRLLDAYLDPLGFDLIQAENGAEALDLTRSRRPDLILMDIGMPVLDGLEATRALKFDPGTTRIPVIAVTAAVIGGRVEAVQRICDGHLNKPVTKGDLMRELAIHHTSVGRVDLRISALPVDNGCFSVLFSVIDTGPGIPAALQKAVFEPFNQGNAWIESKSTLIAALAVHLEHSFTALEGHEAPIAEAQTVAPASDSADPTTQNRQIRPHGAPRAVFNILIADPSLQDIQRLGGIVRDDDHRLFVARSTREATDIANHVELDLMVASVDLSAEIVAGLSANGEGRPVPPLLVSFDGLDNRSAQTMETAAIDLLDIGETPQLLSTRIHGYAELGRLRRTTRPQQHNASPGNQTKGDPMPQQIRQFVAREAAFRRELAGHIHEAALQRPDIGRPPLCLCVSWTNPLSSNLISSSTRMPCRMTSAAVGSGSICLPCATVSVLSVPNSTLRSTGACSGRIIGSRRNEPASRDSEEIHKFA